MSYLKTTKNSGYFLMPDSLEHGLDLQHAHQTAVPFPHSVIDNFLPEHVLETCLKNFPEKLDMEGREFERDQEKFKRSFNPDFLSPEIREVFYSLNSRPFITFLQNLTGIKGLIPDPYFIGGGFHETRNGGHLSVHADFNHHKKLNLERRINVLIYLNKDWKEEYGGNLELWDTDMKSCANRVVPHYNRCVVFNTTSVSYHGHPDPVMHPEDTPRRSIALYYYTATWDNTRKNHSTLFKARPDSQDKEDISEKRRELAEDIIPPILLRSWRRLKHKIKKS